MSLESTILAIRREYSHDEKFKLWLQHVNKVEDELRIERRKNTELIKRVAELENNPETQRLRAEIKKITAELEDAEQSLAGKGWVRKKTHDRLMKKKVQYEKLYWELWQKVNAPQMLQPIQP